MARVLLIIILIPVILFVGLSLYYGSPDPCRMLAAELAKEDAAALEETFGISREKTEDRIDVIYRTVTVQMETGECTTRLWDAWWD